MKSLLLTTAALAGLLAARAPPAAADVTYRWSDPDFTLPFTDASITVSDAAYRSGSLTFDASCDSNYPQCIPPCCGTEAPPSGWIFGFEFPAFESQAQVALTFEPGGLLGGAIHVNLNSDQAYTYEGDGTDWTAVFLDGLETFTEAGFYRMAGDPPGPVSEPASFAVILAGLVGLFCARLKSTFT